MVFSYFYDYHDGGDCTTTERLKRGDGRCQLLYLIVDALYMRRHILLTTSMGHGFYFRNAYEITKPLGGQKIKTFV